MIINLKLQISCTDAKKSIKHLIGYLPATSSSIFIEFPTITAAEILFISSAEKMYRNVHFHE